MVYLLEVSCCMAVFYIIYDLFFHEDTFFQRNRYYLLYTSFVSLFIPLFRFNLNTDHIVLFSQLNELSITTQKLEEDFNTYTLDYEAITWFVYISVALVYAYVFIKGLLHIKYYIERSKISYFREYKMIKTGGKVPTSSFLNYLFWDDSLELGEEEAEKILAHELKHIRDRHTYDILYIQVLKVFFWFNPFIYLYERALRESHEFIADNAVLTERNLKSYNKLIVQSLFKKLNLSLTHHFNQSMIQKRIKRILQIRTQDWMFAKMILIAPFVIMLLFAFSNKSVKEAIAYRNAEPEAGMNAFYQTIQHHIEKMQALEASSESRVLIQFEVREDGRIQDIQLVKGFHEDYNRMALEAFISACQDHPWKPAIVNNEPVTQILVLPIQFNTIKENGE